MGREENPQEARPSRGQNSDGKFRIARPASFDRVDRFKRTVETSHERLQNFLSTLLSKHKFGRRLVGANVELSGLPKTVHRPATRPCNRRPPPEPITGRVTPNNADSFTARRNYGPAASNCIIPHLRTGHRIIGPVAARLRLRHGHRGGDLRPLGAQSHSQ